MVERDLMFDELRSMLARCPQPQNGGSALVGLLKQAQQAAPEVYRTTWLPYLATAPLPRFFAETDEGLLDLVELLPDKALLYVDFSDGVDHEALIELLDTHAHRITELSAFYGSLEELNEVLSHAGLASLPALRLGGIDSEWGTEAVELLARAQGLRSLRSLSFTCAAELQDEHCIALASAPHLHRLEALLFERPEWGAIPMHAISDRGAATMIEALPHLRILDLAGCVSLTETVFEGVAELEHLRAFGVPCAAMAGRSLNPSSEWFTSAAKQLTHLDLSESGMDVSRLLRAQTHLRYLQITRINDARDVATQIAVSEAFPHLRHLGFYDSIDWSDSDQYGVESLGENPVHRDDVQGAMDSPTLPQLEYVSYLDADAYPTAEQRVLGGDWEIANDLVSGHEPRYPQERS